MDPCVLTARAVAGRSAHALDASQHDVRIVKEPSCEHVLLDGGSAPVRLDVVEGTMASGPVILHFEIVGDDRLPDQLAAIRHLRAPLPHRRHEQFSRRLLALEAFDTHAAGASLRETARLILGPGDWPGTGDHRKSLVRRMIAAGAHMIGAGPGAVLRPRR